MSLKEARLCLILHDGKSICKHLGAKETPLGSLVERFRFGC